MSVQVIKPQAIQAQAGENPAELPHHPDYLIVGSGLSALVFGALMAKAFTGYQEGAFYPIQHFEHVINSLVQVIQDHGGAVRQNQEVTEFSAAVRRRLNYDYSPSNYMAYCVVRDLDLRKYGFGNWNVFHTALQDLNLAFIKCMSNMIFPSPALHPGFAPTFWTGAMLYQRLSGDPLLTEN